MKKFFYLLFLLFIVFNLACNKEEKTIDKNNIPKINDTLNKPLVTFIELGSVNCIPCKKMQPILASIEKKYGSQIKVIFYDVWKDEFKSKSDEYNIKLIPTQIFLNSEGKEFHRHEGFYPEEEIDKLLQSNGLKIKG